MDKTCKERSFSIKLKSKANLKNITLNNDDQENVLIEGTIGKLKYTEFVEDAILEIVGDKGVPRVDLAEKEIKIGRCIDPRCRQLSSTIRGDIDHE